MNIVTDLYTSTFDAFLELWHGFVLYFPKIIGAIIILLIGCFIAVGIGKLISGILKKIHFNKIFEKKTWTEAMEKAEVKIDVSEFIGAICKWILLIVFITIAGQILGLVNLNTFVSEVLSFLPNVLVAALIFVIAMLIAEILEKVVRIAIENMKLNYGRAAGIIIKWSIWIFAISAILMQLNIAEQMVSILTTGFIGLIALGGGIAFGLAGKDIASEILKDLKERLKK